MTTRITGDEQPSRYVPKDDPDRFVGNPPPLHLVPYGPGHLTLCEDSTDLLVGPYDRRLAKVGVYVAPLRGENYHKTACRRGNFTPGAPVRLIPEPDNPHDPNAVAVTAGENWAQTAAYISREEAERWGRLLASGQPLRAVSIRGTPAGQVCGSITVLAAHPSLVARLLARYSSAGGL